MQSEQHSRDIIVIGASAGGVEALSDLASRLPDDIRAAIFIVLHVPPYSASSLPLILSRAGKLRATHAVDGERIEMGHIYVAPPDFHMLITRDKVVVRRGPKENSSRPAVDPLFRSAAISFGNRVVGVVLTGALDDGTAGLLSIKAHGGICIVQDPDDAMYSSMPASAVENVRIDYVLPLRDIPGMLTDLARQPVDSNDDAPADPLTEREIKVGEFDMNELHRDDRLGTPSRYSCPECGGVLWEIDESNVSRYRCTVGHAYSSESLLAEQSTWLEITLWSAVRALEETADLRRRMSERFRGRGNKALSSKYEQQAHDAEKQMENLKSVLLGMASVESIPSQPDRT